MVNLLKKYFSFMLSWSVTTDVPESYPGLLMVTYGAVLEGGRESTHNHGVPE